MAFENLFKRRHLRRTLLALAAGAASVFVYLTADHFTVVPATGALGGDEPAAPELGENSLAVFPAASGAPADWSHPVALELTRLLARVPELQVIAPRSAMALSVTRRGQAPPYEPAWTLAIESSETDGQPRLSATLAAFGQDAPAWRVEQAAPESSLSEFIEQVRGALAAHFGYPSQVADNGAITAAPHVYQDYLVARLLQLGGSEDIAVADDLLDQVARAAPDWAPGLAARAYNLLLRAATGETAEASLVVDARALLNRASELRPDLPDAYLYRSLAAHRFDWDWQAAYVSAGAALELAPGDAAVLAALSTAAFTLGKFDEAVEHTRKAITLDPLTPSHRVRLALALEFGGRHQDAIDAFRSLMVFDPDFPGAHARLARTLVLAGRPQSALLHAEIEESPFWQGYAMALALEALGRGKDAAAQRQRFADGHGGEGAVQLAELHAFAGNANEAFNWLHLALDQRDPGIGELLGNPLFEKLHSDLRWDELLTSAGLPAQ